VAVTALPPLPLDLSVKVPLVMVAGLMASLKVAVTLVVGGTLLALAAGVVLNTLGEIVSTIQVHEAGVLSTLPAASVALTWKMWVALVKLL
jgi:hypothetical protein